MVRNSVRRRGKSSHPCFQFTQWLHEIKHSKSPGRWCQSPLSCCVKCIIIKPWADIFKKVSAKPLSLIYAQNTLGVFGLSGNTGKGIFTVQICNSGSDTQVCSKQSKLGCSWKHESHRVNFKWHLSVSSCVVPEGSFIRMHFISA